MAAPWQPIGLFQPFERNAAALLTYRHLAPKANRGTQQRRLIHACLQKVVYQRPCLGRKTLPEETLSLVKGGIRAANAHFREFIGQTGC
jgi:hypothetical protein